MGECVIKFLFFLSFMVFDYVINLYLNFDIYLKLNIEIFFLN